MSRNGWSAWQENSPYTNLGKLYRNYESVRYYKYSGLQGDVQDAVREKFKKDFEEEVCRLFSLMCKDLKEFGYKKVIVGPCEYWRDGQKSMIFAAPFRERNWFHTRWLSDIAQNYFPLACANGLRDCDQFQTQFPLPDSLQGKHVL